jgi:hypothetical protein
VDRAELKSRVDALRWYHTIDLGNGIVTPGVDECVERLDRIGLPASLAGLSVLDIGAWDGFFSFEADGPRSNQIFRWASYVDGDADNVVADVSRNLSICINHKAKKVDVVRNRYPEWWLILTDLVGWGHLDAGDMASIRLAPPRKRSTRRPGCP